MHRTIRCIAGITTVSLSLYTASAIGSEKITIIVGGINKLIYLPPKLAESLGFFRDEGLDVDLQSQQAGVDAENELVAGAAQAVVGFYDHSIDLQAKGKEVESIVVFGLVPGSMEMVRSDMANQIRSMGDLKGKTLGVTGLGSSSAFIGQFLAARYGLKTSDYSTLPVGAGNALLAAVKQQRVDVVWSTEPTTSLLRATGDAKVLVDLSSVKGTKAALGGLYPASSLYVQRNWADTHKDEARKLARAFVRTLHYIQTHSAEEIADKMPSDYYGGDKSLYVKALQASMPMYSPDGQMPPGGPETVLKVLSEFNSNIKGKHIDLARTFTNQFVNQAQASQ